MKLKMNLPIIIILSFISLQQVVVTAGEPSVDATADVPVLLDAPPLDILVIMDDHRIFMEVIKAPPMNPEERESWKSFTQRVANMEWSKPGTGIKIWFSLDENKQLRCRHKVNIHVNCTEMIDRLFSLIKRAKEQGSLTVKSVEQRVKDFILQELEDITAVEQMSANMGQFMKQVGFDLVFNISVVTREVGASDQSK